MTIQIGTKLSKEEVLALLYRFDDSSDIPLSNGLDFESYSQKLSDNAYFVIADELGEHIGFIAYYLNDEDNFAYVPQTVVHHDARHKGLGHLMFSALYSACTSKYDTIRLEVLKDNQNSRAFYGREGFSIIEDRGERLLLMKRL